MLEIEMLCEMKNLNKSGFELVHLEKQITGHLWFYKVHFYYIISKKLPS